MALFRVSAVSDANGIRGQRNRPPRNSADRVVLGGATPAPSNGVWLPVGGGPVT